MNEVANVLRGKTPSGLFQNEPCYTRADLSRPRQPGVAERREWRHWVHTELNALKKPDRVMYYETIVAVTLAYNEKLKAEGYVTLYLPTVSRLRRLGEPLVPKAELEDWVADVLGDIQRDIGIVASRPVTKVPAPVPVPVTVARVPVTVARVPVTMAKVPVAAAKRPGARRPGAKRRIRIMPNRPKAKAGPEALERYLLLQGWVKEAMRILKDFRGRDADEQILEMNRDVNTRLPGFLPPASVLDGLGEKFVLRQNWTESMTEKMRKELR